MKLEKHNIVRNKIAYARGERPDVACILCAVAANDPRVDNLVVHRQNGYFVTLNLYPYNPGHLMVFPERPPRVGKMIRTSTPRRRAFASS